MKTLSTIIVFLFLTAIIGSCGSTKDATKNKLVDQNSEKSIAKVDSNEDGESQISTNATSMYIEEDLYHFGEVKEGEKLQHVFKFKNTGNYPLTIKEVKTSCGCTVTKWNKSPLAIGETGEIGVLFNTAEKTGEQRQTIRIQANTSPVNTKLTILAKI